MKAMLSQGMAYSLLPYQSNGAPGEVRSHSLWVTNPGLYPFKLPEQV